MRGTQLEIRPQALRHNAALARRLAGAVPVYAMVKANAYGHGLALAVQAMAPEVDGFGVALLEEAEALLTLQPQAKVLLLEGCFDQQEWLRANELGLAVVLRSPEQLEDLLAVPLAQPMELWLKVDTGMHRLGLPPEQVPAVLKQLAQQPAVQVRGLMSHLACADENNHPLTAAQIATMQSLAQAVALPYSIANSAALMRYPHALGALVRPGIMLYGASPLAEQQAAELGIAVTQQLSAPVIALTKVPAGETVGYGAGWLAERDSVVAVVALGYGDGYPRCAPAGTPVAISGVRTQFVGWVSMDMLTVYVTDMPGVQVGHRVEFWGDTVSATEVAEPRCTISYELFRQVTERAKRVVKEG